MPVKYQVEITRSAEADVGEIWTYIGSDSVEAATRFVIHLERKIRTLERLPHRCPSVPENELLGSEYRQLILGEYRVIFRIAGSAVIVLRVVHGNRLLDSSFFGKD